MSTVLNPSLKLFNFVYDFCSFVNFTEDIESIHLNASNKLVRNNLEQSMCVMLKIFGSRFSIAEANELNLKYEIRCLI